jgi:hypothetical protein
MNMAALFPDSIKAARALEYAWVRPSAAAAMQTQWKN